MNHPFIARARAKCQGLLVAGATFACCLLGSQPAAAEIVVGEADGWEAYVHGNVDAFLTYSFGDGYPVPPVDALGNPVNRTIIKGGGVGEVFGRIPETDAMGNPIAGKQGTMEQWRVRTGFSPQVFGFGVRKQVTPDLKLRAHMSIWASIETPGMRKYWPVEADFKEAFGAVDTPYGSVTLGRHLGLFSRGIVEMDFLYLHQYGVGFPGGSLVGPGPTAGMIGFGVLAAFFQPGFTYTSPKLAGLQLNVGIYDPVQIAGSWEVTKSARPEFELTWDTKSGDTFAKVFVNGAYQKLYLIGAQRDETAMGLGFGGRVEFGPFHIGAGGHYGKGLGLYYALEGGDTSVGQISVGPGQEPFELRVFDGFAAFAQYAPGQFDINLGFGQSRVHLLESDISGPEAAANTVVKTQTGIAAGFVYHITPNLHYDFDVMRAMFRWYKGEKQDINFISTGITLNW